MKKKLAVIGASGFLGEKICAILSKDFEIVGTGFTKTQKFQALDICNKSAVDRFFSENKFSHAIHAAGLTQVDWCESNENEAFNVNVNGTQIIAQACKRYAVKLFLVSTDYVYQGMEGIAYDENSECNPVNVYGRSKLESEKIVLNLLPNSLIGRVTVLYGFNSQFDKPSFPAWVLEKLREGRKFKVVDDQFSQPTLIDDAANAVQKLLEKNCKGIYNMTGGEYVNRFEFARNIARVFDYDDKLISRESTLNLKQAAKRPMHCKVSIEKLSAQGITMHGTIEGLNIMRQQMRSDLKKL